MYLTDGRLIVSPTDLAGFLDEPYMAGTQDEKMYRVVKDRERWFDVVMGHQVDTSEWATDKAAKHVPLPDEVRRMLTVDLSVADPVTRVNRTASAREPSEAMPTRDANR